LWLHHECFAAEAGQDLKDRLCEAIRCEDSNPFLGHETERPVHGVDDQRLIRGKRK
jgi:hypothetical protein